MVEVKRKAPHVRIPKSLALCADKLVALKEKKSALNKEMAKLDEQIAQFREHLIRSLPKVKASGVQGKLAFVYIEEKEVVGVTDWTKCYAYMHRMRAPELLQKRVNEAAVKERLAAGKKVPGITVSKIPVLRTQTSKAKQLTANKRRS